MAHLKLVGKVGFEPTQPLAADLQSAVTLQLHRSPVLVFSIFKDQICCNKKARISRASLFFLSCDSIGYPPLESLPSDKEAA
jgi:hypothetical protein